MISLLETAIQDLRYGFRGLRRSGVFTLTAVLTLALTMGAISTVFSLADALLFRSLDVEHPDGIVVVSATRRQGSQLGLVSHPDYVRFRERSQTLEALAADYSTAPLWVTANDGSREVNGAVVSANLFPLLGVRPALGRFFSEEEDRVPDRDHVAVLGYELWRDSFGSSPDALGATVKINAALFTVIGVAPPGFRGLSAYPSEIYIPTMMLRVGYRWCDVFRDDCTVLSMIGRLREGRTAEQAQAEMVARMPREWRSAREGENTGMTVFPPRGAHLRAEPEEVHSITLLGLVTGVLLLVCCANLAGLLMARGGARARELAIRVSLGAGGARLVRQLMTESFLLALGGGLLGLLLSLGLTDVLKAAFYSTSGGGDRLSFDFRPQPVVVLALFGVSAGAAFVFGLLPALKSIAAGAAESLRRQSSTGSSRSPWIRSLVGTQAAVATALLAVACLLGASAHRLGQGASFEPSQVALLRLRPRLLEYPPQKAQAYHREVIRRLEALPGVSSVSVVGTGIALLGGEADVSLPEWTDANRQRLLAGYMDIGPRYFETLRTPVRRGREFDDHDSSWCTRPGWPS